MLNPLFQTVIPFLLSAVIVILITVIAEKYGTKLGGIIGTLPTTIIIAFIFIALNKGVYFASRSVAVVPAEMGVNLVFLFVFVILSYRSLFIALSGSFLIWGFLSIGLYFTGLSNIYYSFMIFTISMALTFLILEKYKKIQSRGSVKVHYTYKKIFFRGILTGFVITVSVLLSNIGEMLSGIFSVFPVILSSTMVITYREHGPYFSAGIAKSMIFGSWSVMSYAVVIHFLYPIYGILWGSLIGLFFSFFVAITILKLRSKIT